MMLLIDQSKLAAWIADHPAAIRPGVTPATYPRPLAWWRQFAPDWVEVGQADDEIITLTPAPVGATARERRQRAEALRRWVHGIRPLAAAVIGEMATV